MKKIKYIALDDDVKLRKKEYARAINQVLDSGWFILGPNVKKFEESFAKYLGAKHCIGVGNGLEALQISLMALGIKPGDEIITTPISAVATTLAIIAIGAKPVFVDTNKFGLINFELIDKAITNKTRAVLPVHLYGNPVDIKKIKKLCDQHKISLIEDACQAHGSSFKGKKLGTFGQIGCFSFYPTKNLAAFGDGGAIVTNSKKIADLCYQIRDYGQKSKYVHAVYGLNSRLDELQAAILDKKLQHLNLDNKKRQLLAQRYIKNLSHLKEVSLILPNNLKQSNIHIFALRTKKRDALQKFLSAKQIPALIHYPLLIPNQPLFNHKYETNKLIESQKFVDEVISLPIHPYLKLTEVDFISNQIINFFEK